MLVGVEAGGILVLTRLQILVESAYQDMAQTTRLL